MEPFASIDCRYGMPVIAASCSHSLCIWYVKKLIFNCCLVYVDDILVYSRDINEHIEHLGEIFSRFRKANLKLHPSKCDFGKREVKYLGHIINTDGVKPDPDKIKAMASFPEPTSQKTLKSFLGLCGFYRRYVRSYSQIISPMLRNLKKDVKFEWDEECQQAFDKLKNALVTAPILIFPDVNKPFTLVTDASRQAVGYVLMQEGPDKRLHPVGYGGKSLNQNQKNYSVSEIEMLGIMEGIRHFHPFLANKRFKVVTDHASLKYIESLKMQTGRLLRWALFLMAYDFEVVFQSGKSNVVADAISRRAYPESNQDVEEELEEMLMTIGQAAEDTAPRRQKREKTILIEIEYETEKPADVTLAVIE